MGEGYPIQSWWVGGTSHHPDLVGEGLPPTIQTWSRGYPRYPPPFRPGQGVSQVPPTIQKWLGVPQVPPTIQTWWRGTLCTPYPDLGWVPPTPHPHVGQGTFPSQTWDGVPPMHRPGMGYPPYSQTWDRVPFPARPGMGYPLCTDLGWGTHPTHRPGTGYPLPTSVDRLKILLSLILWMRAVTIRRCKAQ